MNEDKSEINVISIERRITKLETEITWLKETIKKIETRIWYVLGSIIIFGLVSILIALMK